VAGLGGARSTNRRPTPSASSCGATVGTNHLDARLGDALSARCSPGLPHRGGHRRPGGAGAVLVWGPDLKERLRSSTCGAAGRPPGWGPAWWCAPRATGLDRRRATSPLPGPEGPTCWAASRG